MTDFLQTDDFVLLARNRQSAPDRKIMDMPPHFREVYYYLLRRAAPAPVSDGKYSLDRGQCIVSAEEVLRELSWLQGFKRMRYTDSQYKNAMNSLTREGMIFRKKVSRGSLVTIADYDLFCLEKVIKFEEISKKGVGISLSNGQDKEIPDSTPKKTRKTAKPKQKVKQDVQVHEQYFQLVDDFMAKYLENFPNLAKTITVEKNEKSAWAAEAEKLVRIDGHEFQVVRDVLLWAAGDDFWGPNAQSFKKLRKKSGNNAKKKFNNILTAWEQHRRKSVRKGAATPAQYKQGKDYGQSDAGFLGNSK